MSFNITRFRTRFGELARPNQFRVMITPPTFLNDGTTMERLSFMANRAALPGMQIQTNESRLEYGPSRKIGYTQIYGEVPVEFYVDQTMYAKQFFDEWQRKAVGITDPRINDPLDFDPAWYDDVVSEVTIEQLDQNNNAIYRVKLIEAWPISVGEMNLDWADRDSLQRLSVQFAYRYHINNS